MLQLVFLLVSIICTCSSHAGQNSSVDANKYWSNADGKTLTVTLLDDKTYQFDNSRVVRCVESKDGHNLVLDDGTNIFVNGTEIDVVPPENAVYSIDGIERSQVSNNNLVFDLKDGSRVTANNVQSYQPSEDGKSYTVTAGADTNLQTTSQTASQSTEETANRSNAADEDDDDNDDENEDSDSNSAFALICASALFGFIGLNFVL